MDSAVATLRCGLNAGRARASRIRCGRWSPIGTTAALVLPGSEGDLPILALCACEGRGAGVESGIERQLRPGEDAVVDMRVAAPFSWTALHIFSPYTLDEVVERRIEAGLDESRTRNVELQDRIHLLVFMDGESVAAVVELPREVADFVVGDSGATYGRDRTRFRARRRGELTDGRPHLVLVPEPPVPVGH